ncbi:MAG: hypothetical protein ACD_79C00467G0004 [uncultured bacterium]|nr:MAG: hypothetical protein ACD_79C00467G0004 [uncultured bacterium]
MEFFLYNSLESKPLSVKPLKPAKGVALALTPPRGLVLPPICNIPADLSIISYVVVVDFVR